MLFIFLITKLISNMYDGINEICPVFVKKNKSNIKYLGIDKKKK